MPRKVLAYCIMSKIAVIFPGIGYTKDRPLLYYAGKIAQSHGFELKFAKYPKLEWNKEKLKDARFLKDAMKKCLGEMDPGASIEELESADELLFISKSIGTVIATAYARDKSLHARHICFTPIENFADYTDGEGVIAFYGSSDPFADPSSIEEICKEKKIESYKIADANHSLETGDVEADIKNLAFVMEKVRDQFNL